MVNRCDERVIQFWISPLAKPEERKNCVVHRSQMAPNVDNSVSSRRDLQSHLFACERAKKLAGSIHVGSPTAEGGIEESLFRSHCSSPFIWDGPTIGRRSGDLAQTCAKPPSTNNSVPVTKLLSLDARKTTAFAISSGVPMRPRGTAV